METDGGAAPGGDAGNGGSGNTSSDAGAGGREECPAGDERCDCYPNGTCNGGLTCFSGICVEVGATGGAGGSGGGEPGGSGGSELGGSGGTAGGTGGSDPGGSGGSELGGSGGTAGGSGGGELGGSGGTTGGGSGGDPGGSGGTLGGSGGTGATGGTGGMGANPGYWSSGSWHGYAWTSISSGTILPADFSETPENGPFCASGYVSASPDFSDIAMLGLNLNQALGDDPPVGTVVPTGTGLRVTYTNSGGSGLRVQIQGPDGETDPLDRWCYELPSGSGTVTVPYSYFNTECWYGGLGYDYAGEPISSVLLVVPSAELAQVSFSFCLNAVADATE